MKKILLGIVGIAALTGTPALAADVAAPAYKAPLPPVPVFSWTGFYIGVNAGYGWGESANPAFSFVDATAVGYGLYFARGGNVFPNLKPKGFIGGVQAGYDAQFGNFVIGIVDDIDGTDIRASRTNTIGSPPLPAGFVTTTQSLSERLDVLGTVRAKAGIAATNWLFYGTAGLAYGHVADSLSLAAPTIGFVHSNSTSQALGGWAAGAGVSYGWENWELGVEWVHYNLGRVSVTATEATFPFTGDSLTATQRVAGDIVRAVLNYKFGGPVAKY
jgi:outer membrane immunogenic protein